MTMQVITPTLITSTPGFSRASTARYIDSDTVMKTAAVDVVRTAHNPITGASLGLLLEDAATNLLTYSEELNQAIWVKVNATVTSNTTVAPDGTTTADRFAETTASGTHTVQRTQVGSFSMVASTYYTFSIYARLSGGDRLLSLAGYSLGGFDSRAFFNLTTGIVAGIAGTGPAQPTATIEPMNNGWFRCCLTYNSFTGASNTTAVAVFTALSNLSNTFVGVATNTFDLWGAQVEEGSVATSYIPTAAATASRAADIDTGSIGLMTSTVPETDHPAWAAGVSYVIGNRVIRTNVHRIFQNLIAGIDATPPENAPTRWVDVGPTNRWAMFDKVVGTVTTGTSPLTVVLRPGQINSIAFQELSAQGIQVTVKDSPGGTVVYDHYIDLEFAQIIDFYDWFFLPYESRTDAYLLDLPEYANCELTVTITGDLANVSCGILVVGNASELGQTQYGAQIGILNYSRKTTDAFGGTTIVPRGYARRMDVKLWAYNSDINRTYRLLSNLKDIPCMWIAVAEEEGYEALSVYGFYKDFTIDVAYPTINYCNLQIEGLT